MDLRKIIVDINSKYHHDIRENVDLRREITDSKHQIIKLEENQQRPGFGTNCVFKLEEAILTKAMENIADPEIKEFDLYLWKFVLIMVQMLN